MISLNRRRALALAFTLMVGLAAGRVEAASVYSYSTVGTVDPLANNVPNVVYYNGLNNSSVTPPDNIDLGQFVVSALSKTTAVTYNNQPFQIIASVGGDASSKITGVLNGKVGPNVASPSLTATFTSIGQYGNNPLPFGLNLPLNTPMNLALPAGANPAPTSLTGPATVLPAAAPEPASVAVFAIALGGLAFYRRRNAS